MGGVTNRRAVPQSGMGGAANRWAVQQTGMGGAANRWTVPLTGGQCQKQVGAAPQQNLEVFVIIASFSFCMILYWNISIKLSVREE